MNSAKQINFLPIFKVFQNWRIYIFGWHTISWAYSPASEEILHSILRDEKDFRNGQAAAPHPYLREGENKAKL